MNLINDKRIKHFFSHCVCVCEFRLVGAKIEHGYIHCLIGRSQTRSLAHTRERTQAVITVTMCCYSFSPMTITYTTDNIHYNNMMISECMNDVPV